MEELEKKIEKAAEKMYPIKSFNEFPIKWETRFQQNSRKEGFISGANSPEAKALWQEGIYSEEDVVLYMDYIGHHNRISIK